MTRPLALLLMGLCLACCAATPWGRADEFASGLRCGMSEAQLHAYAREFRDLQVKRGEKISGPTLVAQKQNTLILLWLQNDRLEAYQVTWSFPLTNQAWGLKNSLCSGQQFVDLHLVGSSRLAGAEVLLDDKVVGELSSVGTISLDVPLGTHHVVVRSYLGTWSTNVTYDRRSAGFDRQEVHFEGGKKGEMHEEA